MGWRKNIFQKIEGKMNLPLGSLQPLARLEICERTRAVVEGGEGLIGCQEGEVSLRTPRGVVRLRGNGLLIESIGEAETVIVGEILSIEFL